MGSFLSLLQLVLDVFRAMTLGMRWLLAPYTFVMDVVMMMGMKVSGAQMAIGDEAYKNKPMLMLRYVAASSVVFPVQALHAAVASHQPGAGNSWSLVFNAIPTVFNQVLVVAMTIFFVSMIVGAFSKKKDAATGSAASEGAGLSAPPAWRGAGKINIPDDLEERLNEQIKGQELAIGELVRGFRVGAMEYASSPLGMFLLVGATGSGKTETAKQLASIMGWPMHREECNQYSNEHGVSRLIGSSRGYVDSELGGSLTNALMASRHGVLLLDEIEKAHPAVYKTLMTLADEGFITDGMGRVIDARGWLILATSNASQEEVIKIAEAPGMKRHVRLAEIKSKLKKHWPPEILGRMRGVLAYRPISMQAMREIFVQKILLQAAKVGVHRTANIEVDASAIALMEDVYSALRDYGVREMESYLRDEVGLKLAQYAGRRKARLRVFADGDSLRVEQVG